MNRATFPLILSLGLLTACGSRPPGPGTPSMASSTVVQTLSVAPAEWPSTYEAIGTVRARTAAVISSKVMGYVREVRFQAGDRVQAGQVLVELDPRDTDTQAQQAAAVQREAEETLQETDGAIASAKANLELSQVTFKRIEDLFEKKSVSNQEYDEASARLKVARASYEMATAKRRQVAARISQTAAGVNAAAVMRGYTRITAPFDGVVTEKHADPGSLATPGAPLATVEREGAYRLEASIEESRVRDVRPGQSVTVRLEALDRTLEARVAEIVPAVDAASRSYIVKIDLPTLAGLRSGMFGRATFAVGKRSVLAVPAAAVTEQGQLRSVWVLEGGVAHARMVTLGQAREGQQEILSGLNAGEKIVFPIPAGLSDGAKVEVRP